MTEPSVLPIRALLDLSGRMAVVTGAAAGIRAAITARLAGETWTSSDRIAADRFGGRYGRAKATPRPRGRPSPTC